MWDFPYEYFKARLIGLWGRGLWFMKEGDAELANWQR